VSGRGPGHLVLLAAAAAVTLSLALNAVPAQAQNPITDRPSARPLEQPGFLPEEPAGGFELPPLITPPAEAAEAPQGGPLLEVKGFSFEGNRVVPTPALEALAARYAGRAVSAGELEQLRQAISRYYVDRGYINSGALLPDDFYRDGIVHFRIVEGRVDQVRLQGLGRLRPAYVEQRLVREDEPLNVNTLQERFQLLLSDPLFSKVNARLEPGAAPGEATLDVDVTRARPWDLALYANNYQAPSTSPEAVGVTGILRNLTGLGDTLDATLQQGQGDNAEYVLGWVVPVAYRTQIRARYDHQNSAVLQEPLDVLDLTSSFNAYELGVTQTLVDTLRRNFTLGLTYTYRENSTTLLGQPASFVPGEPTGTSRVNALRFGQEYLERWPNQALALRSTFSWGNTNSQPDSVPAAAASLVPAERYFFWLGQAQFTRLVLPNGASVGLRGTVQWTNDRLVPIEQIAVGGVYSVRGYPENLMVRDKGYFGSIELRYPLFDRPAERNRLFVIPFFDFGAAWNVGADPQDIRSIGVGLNWQFHGLSAELSYGYRLVDINVQTGNTLQDNGISFQVRYQF
jgi:hemolysin activation/secretion protein